MARLKRMRSVEVACETSDDAAFDANKKYRKVANASDASKTNLKVQAADDVKEVVGKTETYDAARSALKTQCTSLHPVNAVLVQC